MHDSLFAEQPSCVATAKNSDLSIFRLSLMGCVESRHSIKTKANTCSGDAGNNCNDSTSASDSSALQKSQWDRCRTRMRTSGEISKPRLLHSASFPRSNNYILSPISEIRCQNFAYTPRSSYTPSSRSDDRRVISRGGSFIEPGQQRIVTRHMSHGK